MIFILFACTYLPLNAQTKTVSTVREQMELVQKLHHVNFVYDSSLNLDIIYQGRSLLNLNLEVSLQELFGITDIKWEVRNKYVLLKKRCKFTISGYVLQKNGEPLINATIRDVESKTGTLSNEYGFFSLTLLEGKHILRVTYIGFGEKVESVDLNKNIMLKVYLMEDYSLDEVLVVGDLNSPINTTQTGKVSFNAHDLQTEYALFSSPDVVKTLQSLPGVASGTEMLSGLYVHGGNNDENLFLLDGTPLYQVSHLGGLFSAFNTDIIKNIDFYKSGFPAPPMSMTFIKIPSPFSLCVHSMVRVAMITTCLLRQYVWKVCSKLLSGSRSLAFCPPVSSSQWPRYFIVRNAARRM